FAVSFLTNKSQTYIESKITSLSCFYVSMCTSRLFSCCACRLSKYHSQKPESTRRTIFNRDSTLQLIVEISSGNVNSNVRARAKTYGSTPVSIELPRGRHLGSNACIS